MIEYQLIESAAVIRRLLDDTCVTLYQQSRPRKARFEAPETATFRALGDG